YRDTIAGGLHLLDPSVHLEVGRSAAGAGDMDLACAAMTAAATLDPTHELVPRAMVLLARLSGERLGDLARAEELYQDVLQRFPGTSAADFAKKQLAAAG
ncbi:MAG: tetratricopeptide repeat protein, partial [Myxococcota bacterium]